MQAPVTLLSFLAVVLLCLATARPFTGYVALPTANTLATRVRLLIKRSRLHSPPIHRRALLLRLRSHGRRDNRPAHIFLLERPYPTFQGAACGVI
jgi:hypothetical protein